MFSEKRRGYTLIELLTVIAIIGVLAALIFPIANSTKRRAKQAQCMSNLYQIYTGMKLFKDDEHRYPEFIAGPVQYRDGNGRIGYDPGFGTLVPLEQNSGMVDGRTVALYPEYIDLSNVLKCPLLSLNGDGGRVYTTGDPLDIVEDPMYTVLTSDLGIPDAFRAIRQYRLYKVSSYDYQKPMYHTEAQVHYSLVWSKDDTDLDNYPRQLRWRTPPEGTVITWCSHHRDAEATGVPRQASKDLVLFLDGHAQPMDSAAMESAWWQNGWKVKP